MFQHSGMPSATAYRAVLAPRNTPPNDLECRWVVKRSVISPAVGIGAEPVTTGSELPATETRNLTVPRGSLSGSTQASGTGVTGLTWHRAMAPEMRRSG